MHINEIFISIDGEVNHWGQGGITTFIRTQGCNLRCLYCDTKQSIPSDPHLGKHLTIDQIMSRIETTKVTITGGEPLLQPDIWKLLERLSINGNRVSVETNGTYAINKDYHGVSWVVDNKLEVFNNKLERHRDSFVVDVNMLTGRDWIKFMVSRGTLDRVVFEIKKFELFRGRIAVSCIDGSYQEVVDRLVREKLYDVVLNVQLHKFINVK